MKIEDTYFRKESRRHQHFWLCVIALIESIYPPTPTPFLINILHCTSPTKCLNPPPEPLPAVAWVIGVGTHAISRSEQGQLQPADVLQHSHISRVMLVQFSVSSLFCFGAAHHTNWIRLHCLFLSHSSLCCCIYHPLCDTSFTSSLFFSLTLPVLFAVVSEPPTLCLHLFFTLKKTCTGWDLLIVSSLFLLGLYHQTAFQTQYIEACSSKHWNCGVFVCLSMQFVHIHLQIYTV